MRSIIKRKSLFCRYVESSLFPLINGAIVLGGYLSGYEYYGNLLFFSTVILALLLSDSPRPFLTLALLFIFQVKLEHSPSAPYNSTYYFEGWRLYGVYALIAGLVVSLIVYVIRTKMFSTIFQKKSALLLPLLLLVAVFILNGVGTPYYDTADTLFGLSVAGAWAFFYFFLFAGFQRENPKKLFPYLLECAHVQAWIILTELFCLFYSTPDIVADGVINRSVLDFGWGTCNACGVCLTVLIPLCFYSCLCGKYKLLSLVTSIGCYFGALLTTSRNALLFGTLAVLLCLVIGCVTGSRVRRRRFAFSSLFVMITAGVLVYFFREQLAPLYNSFTARGMDGSSRFEIWQYVFDSFKETPVFGRGFFGMKDKYSDLYVTFFPFFAHNTVVQMLGTSGVIGLAVYLYYRVKTGLVLFKKISLSRLCIILSVAVFLGESLLDVFPFIVYPTFLYSALLAYAELENKSDLF